MRRNREQEAGNNEMDNPVNNPNVGDAIPDQEPAMQPQPANAGDLGDGGGAGVPGDDVGITLQQRQSLAVHSALFMCNITDGAVRDAIITREGIVNLKSLTVMKTDDVSHMAKRLSYHKVNDSAIHLGIVQIRRLQALVFWARMEEAKGTSFDPELVDELTEGLLDDCIVRLETNAAEKDNDGVSKPKKFDPDNWNTFELAFVNYLSGIRGAMELPLNYVIREDTFDVGDREFASVEEADMYHVKLNGKRYESDNNFVYRELKSLVTDTPGWEWIRNFPQDGRGAFDKLRGAYNGRDAQTRRATLALNKLKDLHYKNEESFPFSRYATYMQSAFEDLRQAGRHVKTEEEKVEILLEKMTISHPDVRAAMALAHDRFRKDFTGAVTYLSDRIAVTFPSVVNKRERAKAGKRKISSTSSGRGRGRGRTGGRNNGGRSNSNAGNGNDERHIVNGVDITDPNRIFTNEEWAKIGNKRYIVHQMRRLQADYRSNNRGGPGRGHNPGRGRGRGPGGNRNIGAIEQVNDDAEGDGAVDNGEQVDNGHRGGQAGQMFGGGRYSGRGGRGGRGGRN